MLYFLKSFDEGLFTSLTILSFFLIFVDEPLLVVYLGLSLGLVGADLGLPEVSEAIS